jgi:hypothetical protein
MKDCPNCIEVTCEECEIEAAERASDRDMEGRYEPLVRDEHDPSL